MGRGVHKRLAIGIACKMFNETMCAIQELQAVFVPPLISQGDPVRPIGVGARIELADGLLALSREGWQAQPDLQVLVVGGQGGAANDVLATAELYDPVGDAWVSAAPIMVYRG